MTKTTLRLSVLILAILLSFGIWFGSAITSFIFGKTYSGVIGLQPELFMPMLTSFAVHWYWLPIVAVCLFSSAGLVLSARRVPESFVAAAGIAMPLLVGWFTLFSLSFSSFLGSVSIHHSQRFDFDSLLFSFDGFFSVTFIMIVLLLWLSLRDGVRQMKLSPGTGLVRRAPGC